MSGFELDPLKDEANRSKHGLPLDLGAELFDGPFVEEEDRRFDYGEVRLVATGPLRSLTRVAESCIRGARPSAVQESQ